MFESILALMALYFTLHALHAEDRVFRYGPGKSNPTFVPLPSLNLCGSAQVI